MNIDQTGIESGDPSWPVEIMDLSDHMHEVEMAPGEIVYYESARCLHARTQPLVSGSYANLFVHYRPAGDPDWFKTPHPEAPPAVTAGHHAAAQAALNASRPLPPAFGSDDAAPTPPAEVVAAAVRPGAGGKPTRVGELHTPRPHGGHRVHLAPVRSPQELFDHWRATGTGAGGASQGEL